jgi:hypothetical protein
MPTPCRRLFVSIAATMTIMLALGACVRAPSRSVLDVPSPMEPDPVDIRFDNYAREHVHVYLIGAKREWVLGRVEPGAVATLRIPGEALGEGSTFVRLAVITGERVTFQAASNPRVTVTVAQPASTILTQRWKFAEGQLTSLGR